jgi:hypothetical protein
MVTAAASWAIYGAVKEWFWKEGRVKPEELVEKLLALVLPILKAGAQVPAAV